MESGLILAGTYARWCLVFMAGLFLSLQNFRQLPMLQKPKELTLD
jgi:hypothetical protein